VTVRAFAPIGKPITDTDRARWIEIGRDNPEAPELLRHAIDAATRNVGIENCPFGGLAAERWCGMYKASRRKIEEEIEPRDGAGQQHALTATAQHGVPEGSAVDGMSAAEPEDIEAAIERIKRTNPYADID
jgi:hypothetical protein